MNKQKVKLWDRGERKYHLFVHKIGVDHRTLLTPNTMLLEKFAALDSSSNEFIGLAVHELAENFN